MAYPQMLSLGEYLLTESAFQFLHPLECQLCRGHSKPAVAARLIFVYDGQRGHRGLIFVAEMRTFNKKRRILGVMSPTRQRIIL